MACSQDYLQHPQRQEQLLARYAGPHHSPRKPPQLEWQMRPCHNDSQHGTRRVRLANMLSWPLMLWWVHSRLCRAC